MPRPSPPLPPLPHLAEYASLTVPSLLPLAASRLVRAVAEGDARRDRANAAAAEKSDEGKRVRFEGVSRKKASIGGLKGGRRTVEAQTRFHARDRPGMCLEAYLARTVTYAPIPLDALLLSLLYLNRLSHGLIFPTLPFSPLSLPPTVPLDSQTIHRLLLSTLLLSSKFSSDAYIPHARAAKVGGVTELEVRDLEVDVMEALGFRLYWSLGEVEEAARALLAGIDADAEGFDARLSAFTAWPSGGADADAVVAVSPPVPKLSDKPTLSDADDFLPPPFLQPSPSSPSPTPPSSLPSTPSASPFPSPSLSRCSSRGSGQRSKSTTPRLRVVAPEVGREGDNGWLKRMVLCDGIEGADGMGGVGAGVDEELAGGSLVTES